MKNFRTNFLAVIMILMIPISSIAGDSEVASGEWVEKGYAIKGGWKIVQRGDQKIIVFNEDFKTRNGPDLKVYLSKIPIESIKGSDVEQSSVKIGPLISNKGTQEYPIPSDLNLDDFSSVLVHCEAYTHLWGGGALK